MFKKNIKFVRNERGVTALSYAIITALIMICIGTAILSAGNAMNSVFGAVENLFSAGVTASGISSGGSSSGGGSQSAGGGSSGSSSGSNQSTGGGNSGSSSGENPSSGDENALCSATGIQCPGAGIANPTGPMTSINNSCGGTTNVYGNSAGSTIYSFTCGFGSGVPPGFITEFSDGVSINTNPINGMTPLAGLYLDGSGTSIQNFSQFQAQCSSGSGINGLSLLGADRLTQNGFGLVGSLEYESQPGVATNNNGIWTCTGAQAGAGTPNSAYGNVYNFPSS